VTETILYLFAGVLIFAVLRAILGIVLKGVSDFFGAGAGTVRSGPRPGPRAAPHPVPEALKKDPVCGTFVAPSSALHKTVHGETYYFCSPECQNKFKG
jgi:YHS domain-containing protein